MRHIHSLAARLAPALALVAAAILSCTSCNKIKEQPELQKYYLVEADGGQYFVWLDQYDQNSASGHYYTQEGRDTTAARHDFTAKLTRRSVTISSDALNGKLKANNLSYSLYQEPAFKEGNWKLYRQPCCSISVTNDINYGHAPGYWTSLAGVEQDVFKAFSQGYIKSFKKHDLDLTMDLYRPEGLDSKRPLILFIHGGAFYIGSKDEPAYIDFCKHFASMGYVTASINYRLGFHASKNEIERAGYVALQDAHAALRFLVSHAREYGIDTDQIYVAGSSAGSITALNLAFMKDDERPESTRGKRAFLTNKADLGPIESSGNDLKARFHVRAVANMWGAVSDIYLLENSHTSIISFHGEDDNVVPYAEGYPLSSAGEGVAKMLSEEMYGSACIDKEAEDLGLRHKFYSFPGEGHAFNTTGKDKQPNANHQFIKEKITDFFFEEMVPVPASIQSNGKGRYSINGRGISDVQWRVTGGFILPSSDERTIRVLWCADKTHSLTAAGKYNKSIDWIANL